jgi:branched-chain amino acid transport system substrate-binding protein
MRRVFFAGVLLLAACAGTSSSPANAPSTITLAVIGPMTGDYALYGQQFVQGVQVAIDQVNGAGGIAAGPEKGAKLALRSFDDQLDPKQTADIAQKVVGDSSIWAAIGSAATDNSEAAAPIFDRAGMTFFSWGSSPKIVEGHENVFISAPTHPAYSFAAAETMRQAGEKRVAVLQISGAFGTSIHDYFVQGGKARGLEIVSDQQFNFGDKDFTALLLKARQSSPDVIAPIGFAAETALIVKQARDMGWQVPVVDVGGGGYDPEFLKIAGPAAEGFTGNAPYDPGRNTPKAAALRDAFKSRYNLDSVPPAAPNQYEAALVVVQAIEKGASKPSELARFVRQINIPDTGVSDLSFDPSGLPLNRPIYIYSVRSGSFAFATRYVFDGKDVVKKDLER